MPRKTAIALIAVFALLVIAGWIASSEAALRWAVQQASQRSAGKLVASGVSGSLLFGPIAFARLEYRTPAADLLGENVRISVARWPLLSHVVILHAVDAESITVTPHPSGRSEPAKPPQKLALPVRVALDELRVKRVVFATGESQFGIGPVVASAKADPQAWSAQLKSLETAIGTATGDVRINTQNPFVIDGTVALSHKEPLYEAKAKLAGTLERIGIEATANAKDAEAAASALVTLFAAGPIERLEVNARKIDPQYFDPAAPGAQFAARLTAERSHDRETLRGALALSNSASGPLDAAKIPLAKLYGEIQGTPGDLALSGLLVDSGAAGKLSGKGHLRGSRLDLELHAQRLDAHHLSRKLHPTQLTGSIRAKATQDEQRFTMLLAQKDGRVDVSGTLRDGELTLVRALATAGGGTLLAQGKLSLKGDKPFAFTGRLRNFDPSRFGNYRKARLNSDFDARGARAPVLQLTADLDVFDSEIEGMAAAGKIRWRSQGTKTPDIAVDLVADVGATHAKAKGTLVDPLHLGKLDIELSLQGEDLSDLFPILGIPLPPTPAYELAGHLLHHDDVWTFQRFSGRVGESDLSGDFTLDRNQTIQVVRAELVSENLRMSDLAGFIGAEPGKRRAKRAKGEPIFPNQPFRLERLRAADADIRFTGRRIVTRMVPLHNMTAHLRIERGVVTIDPLDFGMAGGNLVGKISMDANRPVIAATADMRLDHLRLEWLVPEVQMARASHGTVAGRARLNGTGNSVAAMLGTSRGEVTLLMDEGEISDLTLRLLNLDLAHAIVALVRGDERVPVRCMVGHFVATNGHLKPQPFVLDTEHTKVVMDGDVDLGDERVNLRLIAQPKDMSLAALRGPIVIQGPLSSPSVHPDLKRAIARGVAAIALGVVATPVAALVPLFELGTEKDANCKKIVSETSALINDRPGGKPPTPDTTEAAGSSRRSGG